jgi:hypothetical protein
VETPKTNPEGKVISTCFKIIVPNFSRIIRWNASVLIRAQQSDSLASYHQQQQQQKKVIY